MKLHLLSDLHLEFGNYQPAESSDQADVIILAGDIWKKDHGIHWARATWPRHEIVYVAGNHEFYGSQRQDILARLRIAARETGVHFLEEEEVILQGVRFLGCILWTDFLLHGQERQRECMGEAMWNLNDFRVIHEGPAHFSPDDALELNQQSVQWLENKLRHEPFNGLTVVITHHAPSWCSVVPRYQQSLLSACFASRLEYLLGYSLLWIHGHMHDSLDYQINGTRIICNPRGYLFRDGTVENTKFDPTLIVDVIPT